MMSNTDRRSRPVLLSSTAIFLCMFVCLCSSNPVVNDGNQGSLNWEELDSLFTDLDADTLHYGPLRPEDQEAKGPEIPGTGLLNYIYAEYNPIYADKNLGFFMGDGEGTIRALGKIRIDPTRTGYIILYINSNNRESSVLLHIVPNKESKEDELPPILLATEFGSEGADGAFHSWLFDYDKDGDIDIVTKSFQEYIASGLTNTETGFTLKIWQHGAYEELYEHMENYTVPFDDLLDPVPNSDLEGHFKF